jgi:alpha,alpha-trehalase
MQRKDRILEYLWDHEHGMFFDYDIKHERRHHYTSATALYPLWACDSKDHESFILAPWMAKRLVKNSLSELEQPGGLVSGSEASLLRSGSKPGERQWDFPHGWPPHQMLAWEGLCLYGFADEAARLAYRWLYTITSNAAAYNGTIPEKFDVVKRTHKVFAEYGNQGTAFAYITSEGFGWMNASFQIGLDYLDERLKTNLNRLIPPEQIF